MFSALDISRNYRTRVWPVASTYSLSFVTATRRGCRFCRIEMLMQGQRKGDNYAKSVMGPRPAVLVGGAAGRGPGNPRQYLGNRDRFHRRRARRRSQGHQRRHRRVADPHDQRQRLLQRPAAQPGQLPGGGGNGRLQNLDPQRHHAVGRSASRHQPGARSGRRDRAGDGPR